MRTGRNRSKNLKRKRRRMQLYLLVHEARKKLVLLLNFLYWHLLKRINLWARRKIIQ